MGAARMSDIGGGGLVGGNGADGHGADGLRGSNAAEGLGPSEVEGGPSGVSLDQATKAAADFIDAVVWGEHHKVWELLAAPGRDEVLEVATKRGMDDALAARLRSGTASPGETNEFLADLVNGLRAELAGNDLDNVTFEVDQARSDSERATVVMHVPLHPNLGGTLPVGTLELSTEGSAWRVERMIPLTSK